MRGYAAEWCESAGVKPLSAAGVGRAAGLGPYHAWQIVSGRTWPYGPTLLRLARALGVSADAVLVACERAVERRKARDAARRAREDAE